MAQNDPWAAFRVGDQPTPAQQPAMPNQDPIVRRADPYKAEDQQFQRDADARAAAAEQRARQDQALQQKKFQLEQEKVARETDPLKNSSEGERNNEAYYKRALRALQTYDNTGLGPRTFTGAAVAGLPGGDTILKALPDAIGDSPERRISEQAKKDFAAAILRSDSGANAPEPEVERLVSIYFPSAGETDPAVLKNYEEARNEALRALKDKAGKLGAVLPDYGGGQADQDTPPTTPLLRPRMPGGDGGQAVTAANGDFRRVNDPSLANELFAMFNDGRSIDEISAYAQSKGAAPIIPNAETLNYARKNPGWNPFTATRYEPVSNFEKAATKGAQTGYGAATIGFGQMLSGNTLDNLSDDPARSRLAMDIARAENPSAMLGGEITGAVVGSLGGEAALARGLGMASGVGRTAGANALLGAASGAGGTDTGANGAPASVGDRVMGGITGAGTNALAGIAVTGGIRAANALTTPAVGVARRAAGRDPNVAVNQVSRSLADDGLTPRAAAAKIEAARSRGVPMAIADTGENSRELLASVGRARGESRSIVKREVGARQEQQLERLSSAVRRDLGPTANIREQGEYLMLKAKDESAPLYDEAFAAPGASAVAPKLQSLLGRPSVKGAMVRARRIAEEEGRDPTALGFDLNAQGEVILNRVPSWETLHYIKTGLDDVIEGYRDGVTGKLNLDAEGRLINSTKNQLLSAIDRYNPAYKEARGLYSGPASMRDALDLGYGALSRSPDDVAANIKNLEPGEMEMYRLGLRKAIIDKMEGKGDYADKVNILRNTPKTRAVLSKVLGGKPEFDRFLATLADETEMARTYSAVNGNSATAGRQAFDATTQGEAVAGGLIDVGKAYATQGKIGVIENVANRVVEAGRLGPGRAGDNARSEIARILSTSDPEELQAIARQAQRAAAKARLNNRKTKAISARAGTIGAAIGVED